MQEKFCPRCGSAFICRHGDIINCQCASVRLSATTREKIKTIYGDQCLCAKCLNEIEAGINIQKKSNNR